MARTRSRHVEMRGNPDRGIRDFTLFDCLCGQNLAKMHIAAENCDLLPLRVVFGLKISARLWLAGRLKWPHLGLSASKSAVT